MFEKVNFWNLWIKIPNGATETEFQSSAIEDRTNRPVFILARAKSPYTQAMTPPALPPLNKPSPTNETLTSFTTAPFLEWKSRLYVPEQLRERRISALFLPTIVSQAAWFLTASFTQGLIFYLVNIRDYNKKGIIF